MNSVDVRRRDNEPTITVSLMADNQAGFYRWHCSYCGLPVAQVKGSVISVVDSPVPAQMIALGIQIKCYRCKQGYRFVTNYVLF